MREGGETDGVTFEDFVAARSDVLLRTAYLLTRDHALAEDLLQTALAKAWPRWSRIDSHEAYVRKAMLTTYSSWWRRRWNGEHPTDELPEPDGGTRGTAGAADPQAGAALDLWDAVARLPKRQRAVVVLRYFEDLPEGEVADLLGVSRGTVKSQTHKALVTLRIDPRLAEEALA